MEYESLRKIVATDDISQHSKVWRPMACLNTQKCGDLYHVSTLKSVVTDIMSVSTLKSVATDDISQHSKVWRPMTCLNTQKYGDLYHVSTLKSVAIVDMSQH